MVGLGLRSDLDIWAANADNSWLSQNRREKRTSAKGSPLEVRIYCRNSARHFLKKSFSILNSYIGSLIETISWPSTFESEMCPIYPSVPPHLCRKCQSTKWTPFNGERAVLPHNALTFRPMLFPGSILGSWSIKYNRLCLLIHIVWSRWTK